MTILNWFSKLKQATNESSSISPDLRLRLTQEPYCRLRSLSEVWGAVHLGIRIDVNQAKVDDWLRLPGLSIHQARLLVELRQGGVEFHSIEDIAAALGMPLSALTPLEPILQFCYYGAVTHGVTNQININTASVEQLAEIPGLELFLARAIVQNRIHGGRFRDLVDLKNRLFLPGELITQLMHYLLL